MAEVSFSDPDVGSSNRGVHLFGYTPDETFLDQPIYRGADPKPSVNQVLSRFRMAHHQALLDAADRLQEGEPIEHYFNNHTQSEKTRRLLLGGAIDIAKARGWEAPRT